MVKIDTLICIVEIWGRCCCMWPPNFNASKLQIIIYNVQWTSALLNVICAMLSLILGAYHNGPGIALIKSIAAISAIGEPVLNLVICRLQRKRLQKLLTEIKMYLRSMSREERRIFQKYADQYLPFFTFMAVIYFQAGIFNVLVPLLMNSPVLPSTNITWYPLSSAPFSLGYFIIYAQESCAIMQTALSICVDFMMAILLTYLVVKLELLGLKFKKAFRREHLVPCVREHQKLISFSKEVGAVVRLFVMKSTICMAITTIFGAFPILYNEPLPISGQFFFLVICGCLRLYISAWPADDLREMSEKIAWSTYSSFWVGSSMTLRKSIMIVMKFAQKPLTVSMCGGLPPFTREFYAFFVSSTFSYFTTLRAILRK